MAANPSVLTPIGKLCFPALFTAKVQSKSSGALPRFSCILVFDTPATNTQQYRDLRKAVADCAAEKWGADKAQDGAFMRSINLPFKDPGEKDYAGFEDGAVFISPWSKEDKKPGVIDVAGNDILVPDDVFAGQLARATVRAFAYDTDGNKGVSFALEHVQIVKADMPRIDGRRSAQQAFNDAPDDQMKAMGINPNAAPSTSGGAAPAATGGAGDNLPF